jgi:drug/metabolite transporter (DMT)-like permease
MGAFAAMSVIWGMPYLFIKVAVDYFEPPVVVFGRTSLAALALLIPAARIGAIRAARRHLPTILVLATIEMAIPWLLLSDAEKRLPSGLTGRWSRLRSSAPVSRSSCSSRSSTTWDRRVPRSSPS